MSISRTYGMGSEYIGRILSKTYDVNLQLIVFTIEIIKDRNHSSKHERLAHFPNEYKVIFSFAIV